MGLTGLMLIGYLVAHLAGNVLIFQGQEAFNAYAAGLHSIHGFVLIELALALVFIVHIWTAISLTIDNRKARPVGYQVKKRQSPLSALIMIWSGLIVLAFLAVHVVGLRFGPIDTHPAGVFGVMTDQLTNPIIMVIYVLGVVLLAPHLKHGIQSSLRSVGLSHDGYLKMVNSISIALATVLTIGFAVIPLYIFAMKG